MTTGPVMEPVGEAADLEKQTMRRVMLRIMPLLMLGYFLAYLDRINIGFAGPCR